MDLSLIVLTRNEENIVENNLKEIVTYVSSMQDVNSYEILVCDRSEDSTPLIVQNLAKENIGIKYLYVNKMGIGAGIKHGIDKAKFDFIVFYPIDMAWKLDIINRSITELCQGYDVVYGSRYVKGSNVKRPFKRRMFSLAYRLIIGFLFNLKIKDLNGTIALKKSSIVKFRNKIKDDYGFMPTEVAIYVKKYGLNMKEIPSNVTDLRNNSNQFLFNVASKTLKTALKKRIELFFDDYKY